MVFFYNLQFQLLVQHDDPDHPLLGRPLHPASPLQEQPGCRGRDCWLGEHPDDRDQGQGDGGHPHQGFVKERRIISSSVSSSAASPIYRGQTHEHIK